MNYDLNTEHIYKKISTLVVDVLMIRQINKQQQNDGICSEAYDLKSLRLFICCFKTLFVFIINDTSVAYYFIMLIDQIVFNH